MTGVPVSSPGEGGRTFIKGDVVRYQPVSRWPDGGGDVWWCREGHAICQEGGRLIDTYWAGGGESHVLNEPEYLSAELLFNLADYEQVSTPSGRGLPDAWEQRHPNDRAVVPSQHGLQHQWLIRIGSQPDESTIRENAREAVREAREKLDSARHTLDYRLRVLADLESKVHAS